MAAEMESTSIAQICYFYNVPFLIVRAISDLVGAESQRMMFNEFVQKSSDNAALLLEELFKNL